MKLSGTLFCLLLSATLFWGCGEKPQLDQQSLKKLSSDIEQQLRRLEESRPELQRKANALIEETVVAINDRVDLKRLRDELMETSTFESMNGFYKEYSPFRSTTGNESLDDLVETTKKLREYRVEPDADMNRAAEDAIQIALGDKLAELGLNSEQLSEFMSYLNNYPDL